MGCMRLLDKDTNQQPHQILIRQLRIRPIRIAQSILTRIQSGANPIHPKRTPRLTLILHRDIHRIQIHHLLKSHHHNIGRTVLMPIGTQPTRQTLILPLGIHVPRTHKHPALFVLREFILTRADLFVDPRITDFGGGLAVADASVFGFFVGGAVGDDDAGSVVGFGGAVGGEGGGDCAAVEGGVVESTGGGVVGGGGAGCGGCACAAVVVEVVVGGGASGYASGWVGADEWLWRRWWWRGRL
mmetsp:Transcript_8354/g.14727  ORF Transcript_8354/g.14727 Transcript_8354/m.14727 type:complete len:242 (-) Transcript_8354:401-1126(-)